MQLSARSPVQGELWKQAWLYQAKADPTSAKAGSKGYFLWEGSA